DLTAPLRTLECSRKARDIFKQQHVELLPIMNAPFELPYSIQQPTRKCIPRGRHRYSV
ncbi:hypothetical protein P7K49_027943, partial [Saguinus oedipus]